MKNAPNKTAHYLSHTHAHLHSFMLIYAHLASTKCHLSIVRSRFFSRTRVANGPKWSFSHTCLKTCSGLFTTSINLSFSLYLSLCVSAAYSLTVGLFVSLTLIHSTSLSHTLWTHLIAFLSITFVNCIDI